MFKEDRTSLCSNIVMGLAGNSHSMYLHQVIACTSGSFHYNLLILTAVKPHPPRTRVSQGPSTLMRKDEAGLCVHLIMSSALHCPVTLLTGCEVNHIPLAMSAFIFNCASGRPISPIFSLLFVLFRPPPTPEDICRHSASTANAPLCSPTC